MTVTVTSVYIHHEFWALVVATLLLPAAIFVWLAWRRRISRLTVALIALSLVVLSGADAILLQRLGAIAAKTSSLHDDRVFASEFSLALYLIPLVTAGMGINLLSHLLHEHLIIAELEYDRERRRGGGEAAGETGLARFAGAGSARDDDPLSASPGDGQGAAGGAHDSSSTT